MALPVPERRQMVAEKKLCFNCLSATHQAIVCRSKFTCKRCRRKHHLTLHPESENIEKKGEETETVNFNTMMQPASSSHGQAILPTISVNIKNQYGERFRCRALLDSGSQSSFITEDCVQRFRLQRGRANVNITGITAGSIKSKGRSVLVLQSLYDHEVQLEVSALIINKLPSKIPAYTLKNGDIEFMENIQLADPEFRKPAKIDILIGADKFFTILESDRRLLGSTILQKTVFGWVVSGQPKSTPISNSSSFFNIQIDIDIDKTLRRFWEIEEVTTVNKLSPEDTECEAFFNKTFKRQTDGRFIVQLPFRETPSKLGNSLMIATRRFLALERKLSNNENLRNKYIEQIREYIEMGHMTEIPESQHKLSDNQAFYLPHHAVFKESSNTTKMRVVFDGSSKTSNGVSLNDILMVGPTIQPTLWTTLMRFRCNRIALTADIEKMYRQVIVSDNDTNYQRLLWRENSTQKIRHYQLTRVTFGLACSAYLAIRSLQQLARDNGDKALFPHIINNFYVDDFLSGSENLQSAIDLKENINLLLKKGGFSLRKWRSNIPSLSDDFNNETITQLCNYEASTVSVLGLHWDQFDDTFTFRVSSEKQGPINKRKILSEASRVFDPLGFLSPSIVLLKILFQKMWFLKIEWDDKLPEIFENNFKTVREEFKYFEEVKIPRFTNHYQNIQIHGFADASEVAYCAVIYSRTTNEKGEIVINLLASKTKVSPVKKISLPRLELCASHLLSKLLFAVKQTIITDARYYAWTDSSIVLAWLSTYPSRWKTFIANRTSEILDKFPRQYWGHVRSADNPADHGSRGITPQRLLKLKQWWQGPDWLKQSETLWPTTHSSSTSEETAIKAELSKTKLPINIFQTTIQEDWLGNLFARRAKLQKIFRVVAYVRRFIRNSKTKNPAQRISGELKAKEIETAKTTCIIWVQISELHTDVNSLRRNKVVDSRSNLLSLAPFIDASGLLRVGGRLFNTDSEYDNKHPVILPSNHIFTEKLIWETHLKNLHAGPTLTNNLIRQKYWIVKGRTKIRSILKNCVICAKYARKTSAQLMGNLPVERVIPTRPFTNCGIDFAGPLYFAAKKGRGGTNPVKGYICIFVCLSVKAVHIEPVSDLTSEAFLAALRRFSARRGVPRKIYTDNGSNFIGAKRILNEAHNLIQNINKNYIISEFLSESGIDWHFIPPAAPHFGGLWESAVKSVKTHLLKTTKNVNLTFEEMATLLCQIENVLNSRPLCVTSTDDDYEVLTPAHFLIGTSTGSVPEKHINAANSTLSRWQRIQARIQIFWNKYRTDYINNIQQRRKWQKPKEEIKVGDIVLIKEDNLPVCKWPLGRILETHPGDDNLTRVVTIKTSSTTLQRPIVKICKLPVG